MEVEEEDEGRDRNPRTNIDGGESEPERGRGRGENGVKEWGLLLGSPTFEELGSGRVRCVETGHELPAKDVESYGKCKACRLALVDVALSQKKPPLNMFKPDPLSKSKLICKLTGDTINKSEEHIWKHVSGKRFLNKLQEKEVEKLELVGREKNNVKRSGSRSNSKITGIKKDQKRSFGGDDSMERKPAANDNGRARWESCTSSDLEIDDDISRDGADEEDTESGDLVIRTKRMSIAVGPSSFASRKKKSKNVASYSNGD